MPAEGIPFGSTFAAHSSPHAPVAARPKDCFIFAHDSPRGALCWPVMQLRQTELETDAVAAVRNRRGVLAAVRTSVLGWWDTDEVYKVIPALGFLHRYDMYGSPALPVHVAVDPIRPRAHHEALEAGQSQVVTVRSLCEEVCACKLNI